MHIRILLNSIALEPNRWTDGKTPFFRLEELVEPIARHDFKGIEVWQNHLSMLEDKEIAELRERAGDLGLDFPVVGFYPELHLVGSDGEVALSESLGLMDKAAALGANTVKMFVGSKASKELTDLEEAATFASLETLIDAAEDRDLLLTGETHAGTLFDSVGACRRALHQIDSDELEICFQPFDPANTESAIADYTELAESVIHVHLQGRIGNEMSLLEDADLDYERFLEALEINGFAGYLSIEFVKDCVVDRPEDLDIERVLSNAAADREFVRRVLE